MGKHFSNGSILTKSSQLDVSMLLYVAENLGCVGHLQMLSPSGGATYTHRGTCSPCSWAEHWRHSKISKAPEGCERVDCKAVVESCTSFLMEMLNKNIDMPLIAGLWHAQRPNVQGTFVSAAQSGRCIS